MNEENTSNCPLCNLKGEIQVTGKVINPYYRSSLIFLINLFRTFTTGWRGRKQKVVQFLFCYHNRLQKKKKSLPLSSYCTSPSLFSGTMSHVTNSSASTEPFLHPNKSNSVAQDDKFMKHLWKVKKQHATLGQTEFLLRSHISEKISASQHMLPKVILKILYHKKMLI